MKFYIPPNLQSDFKSVLASPVATQMPLNFDPLVIINAIVPEIDHREKSSTVSKGTKYTYASTDISLEIGDYLQDDNGIYLINQLRIQKFPSCYKFLLISCNAKYTVTRYENMVQDDNGNILIEAGDHDIAKDIYCSSLVSGAQFQITSGNVGVVPVDTVTVQTRFTVAETKNIAIGDNFLWFGQKYQVQSLDYSQISIEQDNGMLGFVGKRVVVDTIV